MWRKTRFTELLQLDYPIIQAPMAGGASTPELVAAVSNSGGLGSFAGGYLPPQQIAEAIRAIRGLTGRPFAVNLFVPEPFDDDAERRATSAAALSAYRAELGLGAAPELSAYAQPFAEQMEVLLEARVPLFSFTFGIPEASWLERLRAAGTLIVGTATTVREALALEQAGVDAIVAQGAEAGGHRGTFLGPAEEALIGTLALVPQVADAVRVPVIAAGGIMDGRGLLAVLALGAAAAQFGSAFLTCDECGIHPSYRAALFAADEASTALTTAFSGRAARGIRNRFLDELRPYEGRLPVYPVQNALTRDIRQAAAQQNRPEFMSLWAGQGLRLAKAGSAAELVAAIVAQADAVAGDLAAS